MNGTEFHSTAMLKERALKETVFVHCTWDFQYSAGNNFSLFTRHMSFQILLLTDNTVKKRTQDVLVRCSVIVSDHNVKLAGHFQNLVGQCPMTDCYFQLQ